MKILSEKRAGSRDVSGYDEAEAKFCSRNFHVLLGERIDALLSRDDNVNTA